MTSRLLISLSLLLAAPVAWAETAEEFFNGGAQLYISNNIPVALEKVEAGRKAYPEDEKLKKLEELLKQQQQSQSQQSQNQQQQNQQQQNSQNQKQDQKQDQNQSGQKQDQQPQPSKSQKQDKSDRKPDEKQDQEAKAGQMTPRDAKRLLDSEKNDEQFLVPRPDGKPPKDGKMIKDW